MTPFDFPSRTRIVCAPGAVRWLGNLCVGKPLNGDIVGGHPSIGDPLVPVRPRRVLMVCDRGIISSGLTDAAVDSLEQQGITVERFSDFDENPDSSMIDRGAARAAEFQPDLLVGLGGGSSLDCCKGINFVYSCGGSIHDYRGINRATDDLLPMIAIPTTAGTGSEVQSFAIISDAQTHVKMPCGDSRAAPKIAVLDPELSLSQPPRVTALAGIDAISHAVETYVTKRRNPWSLTFSRRSFGLLARAFPVVLQQPDQLDARAEMLLGASIAGMAIESSMLGAAHATANPLTARHNIPHGQAVAVTLPAVVKLNATEFPHWYGELVREHDPAVSDEQAANVLSRWIREWATHAGLATKLSELSVDEKHIDAMVPDALEQWTGNFNPVSLNPERVQTIYQSILS